jgi:hypothetical protein
MRCVILISALACAIVTAAVHRNRAVSTDMPILTGAQIVAHGFNAKQGTEGLWPVIEFTYNFNTTWISPVSGISYQVPDELNLADIPESSTNIVEILSDKYSDMFNQYTSWFKFSVGVGAGAFSLSVNYDHEMNKVHQEISETMNLFGFSQYWSTYYSLDMAPAYMLNPSNFFKLAVSKLPASATTAAEQALYQEFVQAYGTHYVCYGAFGGSAHLDEFLNKTYEQQYSASAVSTQMGLSFHYYMFNISPGTFHNRTEIKMAKWFAENVQASSFFKGGAPAYQTNNTIQQWLDSVPDYAGLLNTTLCPLSDLVQWDPVRQQSLSSYVTLYLS